MRKIFTILLLLAAAGSYAQTTNNEWIDYSKPYYKFKVAANGLLRIPQAVLATAGLDNTPVQNFQLFRNGVEVPIYTSVASGVMGASDYIEFWGMANDGKPDRVMYRDPAYQHTDKISLQTDTAVYFLTVNNSGSTFHFNTVNNDTTNNTLPVEPYFISTAGNYFKNQINPGFAQLVGEYVYSSSYDVGEFWSSVFVTRSSNFVTTFSNLFVYPGGPDATIKFGTAGCYDTLRTVRLKVNNVIVKDTIMNSFNDLVSTAPVALSSITSNSAAVQLIDNCLNSSDRIVASFYELTYPRQFNFGNATNFYFELPARSNGYYLKIANFNAAGSTPVLYDLATGERYVAISGGGILYFLLQGSNVDRKLELVSEAAANIKTVTSLTPKTFINFDDPVNQGNYIIISNPLLYTGSSGNNPVDDYKTYRRSIAGGSFNAQVVDINELIDQFAFGIKKHPLSVKNFLNYARAHYVVKPEFVFLIGRGLEYNDYRLNQTSVNADVLNQVPTFGYPPSDMMLSSADAVHTTPLTPIGRLGAINGVEVETYLDKVKEYEQAQQNAANTIADRGWMKNVVHVTGANDPYLGAVLCNYMAGYAQIISDVFFGGKVTTFCKSTSQDVDLLSNKQIADLFEQGITMLTYFGHSSSSTLAYNLDDPNNYNNQGKYPVFYVNGCYAGNFFTFDQTRLSNNKTLSETYVLAKERGSIAFVASTHFGIVNYLNLLLNGMYNIIAKTDYGKPLGIIQADACQSILNQAPNDYYARLHAEEMTLHGDPALKLNGEALPDYDVEASQVKISPSFISVADNSFSVKARFVNLGKAVPDSIWVEIKRQYPNGSSAIILRKKIPGILYDDSVSVDVPIIATRDKGQNYITVTIDADNNVAEVTEINNTVTTGVYIYEEELRPIYPYNYAIVNNSTQKLSASTANPLAVSAQYVMQIDTTESFNSPRMVSKMVSSTGGVLEFDPGFAYQDSTVYYWRTSIVPAANADYHWNEFSFIYLSTGGTGFNQSHYFQDLQSTGTDLSIGSDRQWHFGNHINNIYVTQGIYGYSANSSGDLGVSINNQQTIFSACVGNSLVYNVIDPISFQPWKNVDANGNSLHLFGSADPCDPYTIYNFEYSYMTSASRHLMMNFMDSIPVGFYVVVRSFDFANPQSYAATWRKDTTLFGSNKSLYHSLLAAGFTQIDSINQPRCWVLIYRKGVSGFTPIYKYSQGLYDKVLVSADCPSVSATGSVLSPLFGPAKQWKQVHWRGNSVETPSTDSVGVTVYGVDTLGNQTPLFNLDANSQDVDISSINVAQYPYVQLKLRAVDSTHVTPYQLKYWRLNYDPVPEGAIAPNIFFQLKDTINIGDPLQFGVAFKNVSLTAFDSMRINVSIIDKNNVTHLVQLPKKRPIIAGDTLKILYDVDTKDYAGSNTLYIEVNPANSQPEQFHFNNFLYKNFYIISDITSPLLDVTFDNVHILNEDIVSAKPHIQMKLKDDGKSLRLDDTTLFNVQLRYPDGSLHPYFFSTDTLRFTPAPVSGTDNTATVDFYPVFTKQFNPEGDEYQLIVTAKDKSGNYSGSSQYRVSFKIITKPMISNMLNYPNPFTTSTAFVFTITGSDVPQNIKIQILTITGKIVREVTKDELGPLHVGRNITEFKWDGTDMYGQRLANGVYIYHVVTNLNGKSLDKYKSADDNTDQYFNKGYGKMYLMR